MPENMKCVRREEISENFQICENDPIPCCPSNGARVKVCYAGACYTDSQVKGKKDGPKKGLRMPGIHDTSLFPGVEVSGVIDQMCNKVEEAKFKKGDKVIVYPDDELCGADNGFAEYMVVKNVDNLIRVPDSLPLEIAALLPSGALRAFAAVQRAKPFIQSKMDTQDQVNVLIVGAGGLGLWTLKLVKHFIGNICAGNLRVTIADTSIEKLMIAKDEGGCFDVIHWCNTIHEEYIIDRTNNVCQGGVDVAIDFVSSQRTIRRIMKVLREEGVLLVGGNSKYEVPFCLNELAQKNQSVLGVHRGTRTQLQQLVDTFAEHKIKPPCYSIFPVEEASAVFEKLNQCQISGRAVLQVCNDDIS